jgi:hypothetical protein
MRPDGVMSQQWEIALLTVAPVTETLLQGAGLLDTGFDTRAEALHEVESVLWGTPSQLNGSVELVAVSAGVYQTLDGRFFVERANKNTVMVSRDNLIYYSAKRGWTYRDTATTNPYRKGMKIGVASLLRAKASIARVLHDEATPVVASS